MLVFIGTAHFHPQGPSRLNEAVERVRVHFGSSPKFMAVECSRQDAIDATENAASLSDDLRNRFQLSESQAQRLSALRSFEGRFALAQSASAPVVWLNDGLSGQREDWLLRVTNVLNQIESGNADWSREESLLAIHCEADLWTVSTSIENRDQEWANEIEEAVSQHVLTRRDYAIVIVGAAHLRAELGQLFHLLGAHERRRVWLSRDWGALMDRWMSSSDLRGT